MKQIVLLSLLLTLASCDCRYVKPIQICGAPLILEILDTNDENIFTNQFSLDSLELYDDLNLPVDFSVNKDDNTFQFEVFDCRDEADKFDQAITKVYLLKLNAGTTDPLALNFKVVPADCGGTKYEYFTIIYRGSSYDLRRLHFANTLYR